MNGLPPSGRAAVFLDKDGTLVEDVPYNVDPARIRLLPGVRAGLHELRAAGFALVLVSNQPGVARGYFAAPALQGVRERLERLLGLPLDGFYCCPHEPAQRPCDCRKPAPGLLLRACRELGLAAEHSWMVGDILNDVEAGRLAGCRTILLDNGGETEWRLSPRREPHYRVTEFRQGAAIILKEAAILRPRLPSSTHMEV